MCWPWFSIVILNVHGGLGRMEKRTRSKISKCMRSNMSKCMGSGIGLFLRGLMGNRVSERVQPLLSAWFPGVFESCWCSAAESAAQATSLINEVLMVCAPGVVKLGVLIEQSLCKTCVGVGDMAWRVFEQMSSMSC